MAHDTFYTLAAYAAADTSANLPDRTLEATVALLTDTIACILAGTSAQGVPELQRATKLFGGPGNAQVAGFGETVSAENAAFLNGVLCHATDYDDTHDEAVNHGCVTVVPALLALCDILPSGRMVNGAEFLTAMAIGLDVANRIGLAVTKYLHTGWLPTTLWGPIGSAAACGRILGLDQIAMHHAFGFAYSQAHGNRQALVEGTLAKRIQPGFAAAAGLRAALLADQGLTAAKELGEGIFGIRELYTQGLAPEDEFTAALVNDLGVVNETNSISIKPYPCCRCTHPVIDAALAISSGDAAPTPEAIESAIVRLPPHSHGQIGRPFEIRNNPTVDAQFSAAYTAALALTGIRPGLGDFNASSITGKKHLVKLAAKVRSEQFSPDSAGVTPVELEVRLSDGTVLQERVDHATGSPERRMSDWEMHTKIIDCAHHAAWELSSEEIDEITTVLKSVDTITDMRSILSLIAPE